MSQWVRPLHQVTPAEAEWHAPQTKSFSTTAYCGKVLEGAIEVATDEKAAREGRCSACATRLAAHEGTAQKAMPRPVAQTRRSPVKKAAVKKTATKTAVKRTAVKRTAVKKAVRKPAPKRRTGKAPAAKHPVRRSRRGRA